ncbi:MAG: selenium cofactor biosynthesis protein YqeC [Bacillota bacterium]|nr:selenium cofactor biosynthesis protein YqeC [Bacillota bacterium]
MNPSSLADSLELKEREIISAYGAGGKSTLLNRLAHELAGSQKKVILTTTTKIYKPAGIHCVIKSDLKKAIIEAGELLKKHDLIALGSSLLPENKLNGIEISWVKKIFESGIASYLLVEADGSAGRPIKGYASYEPVLPPDSSLILPVLGIDAIGKAVGPMDVHRPEILSKITGAEAGEPLGVDHLIKCLKYMIKRGHNMSPQARIIPIVNKVELTKETNLIKSIGEKFIGEPLAERFLFTAAKQTAALKFVFDLSKKSFFPFVSCVILAAGLSNRMGMDKLTVKIKEETIFEHSLKNVLGSGVDEVIVVTRPKSFISHKTFYDSKVKVVTNHHFDQGISSSLKTGITAVHSGAQGIIFTLADQPFIPAEVYDTLIKNYADKLNLLTFPLFEGRRGNPVLFDRRIWPLLMDLEGDEGGKQVFSSIPENEIFAIETKSSGVLVDIDTPEDLRKYRNYSEVRRQESE